MTYTDIFYLGPEHIVSSFYGDYRLSPGRIRVESWMADILIECMKHLPSSCDKWACNCP